MATFHLQIVTPDGMEYEGTAEEVIVRTTTGDIGIMAGHVPCVAPLGMGMATIVIGGQKKYAACIGGILSVSEGKVTLVPTTFEWAEDIDAARAERAESNARETLAKGLTDAAQMAAAEAKLKRALIRKSVKNFRNN